MDVRVIYETVEGQTGKIADFVRSVAEGRGHAVEVVDTGGRDPVSFEGAGAAILAAPVHQRRHPGTFEAFLGANVEALAAVPTLMLSVSLSAAFKDGLEEADDYLVEMKMRTGFAPDAEALVAGAIRIGKYDYFAAQVVRHVVLRGRNVDRTLGEHEFTDWEALRGTVSRFLEGCEARAGRRAEARVER